MDEYKLTKPQYRLLRRIAIDRIDQIHKRINQIRKTKTYREKIISNFRLEDYRDFLRELRYLDSEYKRLLEIFNLEEYPFSLLTSGELDII